MLVQAPIICSLGFPVIVILSPYFDFMILQSVEPRKSFYKQILSFPKAPVTLRIAFKSLPGSQCWEPAHLTRPPLQPRSGVLRLMAPLSRLLFTPLFPSSFRPKYLFLGEDSPDTLPVFHKGPGFTPFRLTTICNCQVFSFICFYSISWTVNSMREECMSPTMVPST